MGKSRLLSIPFALGIDERTAPRELEPRALREAVNVRQRRLKAFGMRADYLAQSMTEFDGTLIPYDLYNLNGRLFALGNRQVLFAGGAAPTDLFEFVEQPGGTWKGTLPVGSNGTRVAGVTDLRNIGQSPDVATTIGAARVAAVNGLVCLVYGLHGTAGGGTSFVHIFRASTDSTILQTNVAITNGRVVVAGDSFWIIGVNSASDLVGFRFDTGADDVLQGSVTLYTGTVTNSIFDAVSVNNTAIVQFATVVRDGSTTTIRRFNEAGVQQTTFAGPAVAADIIVLEADAVLPASEIMVATRVGAADVLVSTYDLVTNALLAGPTAMFGEAVSGDLSIVRAGRGGQVADLVTEDATARVLRSRFITDNHLGNSVTPIHNYTMGGTGVSTPLGMIQPLISGDQSNHLFFYDYQDNVDNYVAAQTDDQIANPLIGESPRAGGQCCVDATTGLFYWARLYEGTDGQVIPGVSEFRAGSTDRRQACQVGNAMLLTGSVGLSFGGRQVVESGFLERPVFVSTTSSNTGGSLIPGAEYDWIAIFQWIDEQNKGMKSRLSDIQTLTIGAADNSMTALVYAPHTMKRDANSGSTPVISLYRTDATALTEPATLLGTNVVDPPSASLNGQTLQFFVTDSAGTDPFVVNFGPGDNNPTTIAATINAVSSGRLTATNEGGRIRLTVDEEGEVALLQIFGTTGATILGFPANSTAEGSTTFVKGSVFHLAASTPVPLADDIGEPVTIIDIKSDEDLLESETLYTQAEQGALTGILQREAPPPSRFAAAVGARAFLGGLPDPSEVAISFELAPAEALAFSSEFAFRAWVDGDVTAVAGLDNVPIAFTADAIYRFPNKLPNDQGGDGELAPAVRIPSEGGCINEHSILETSMGLFYESRDGKLMLLPRGGAAPVWADRAGQLVQDSLTDFPTITGAAYSDEDHVAAFFCQNLAGSASIILIYDLRIGQWYRDVFSSPQVIRAAVDYEGRLAYIDSATVRLQSASLTPSAFIPYNAKTGSLSPFQGEHGGHGHFICVTVNGEFRGNATLQCRISYDDGVTFTALATKTFATPALAVGESFVVQWYPRVRKGTAFVLDFSVTSLAGAASPGLILNTYTIEVTDAQPIARQRTTADQRG